MALFRAFFVHPFLEQKDGGARVIATEPEASYR